MRGEVSNIVGVLSRGEVSKEWIAVMRGKVSNGVGKELREEVIN